MSDAKHTPGPWAANGRTVSAVDPRYSICEMAHRSSSALGTGGYKDALAQDEANARLIAAAPELLGLLTEYVAYNGEYAASMPPEEWVVRVQAAVRKLSLE